MGHIPDWLQWLRYLVWPIALLTILLVFGYCFSTLSNWIAAPFNGLLAEQLEAHLTGVEPPDTGIARIVKDIPRIMKREWQKFVWYLPKAIVLLLLYFIPGVGQTVAPILWFIFSAWMLAIQYCDYPFDNQNVIFREMHQSLREYKMLNYAVWRDCQPVYPDTFFEPFYYACCGVLCDRDVGRHLSPTINTPALSSRTRHISILIRY